MNLNIKKYLCLILFCIVIMPVIEPTHAAELTFACEDKQYFPIVMGDDDRVLDYNPGLGVEAVRILESKLALKIKIVRLPWMRCLHNLQSGKVDALFTASYKYERKRFGRFPEKEGKIDVNRRFTSESYVLYRLKGSNVSFDGNKFINIKGKVGAPRGYSIVETLKNKGLAVDESPGTRNDFLKLVSGRVQAVAALEMTGDYYLDTDRKLKARIEKVAPPIVMKPYYFVISHRFYRENTELAETIFNMIAEIREDPAFKNKIKNYLVSPK